MPLLDRLDRFKWDEKKSWSINGMLMEKACQWEKEAHQAHGEEKYRKIGHRWVNNEGNQVMDDEDENADNMLES
jgi:hypothetical protein